MSGRSLVPNPPTSTTARTALAVSGGGRRSVRCPRGDRPRVHRLEEREPLGARSRRFDALGHERDRDRLEVLQEADVGEVIRDDLGSTVAVLGVEAGHLEDGRLATTVGALGDRLTRVESDRRVVDHPAERREELADRGALARGEGTERVDVHDAVAVGVDAVGVGLVDDLGPVGVTDVDVVGRMPVVAQSRRRRRLAPGSGEGHQGDAEDDHEGEREGKAQRPSFPGAACGSRPSGAGNLPA